MQPIATDVPWSVCLSVGLCHDIVLESIEVAFGLWTRPGPTNHALDGFASPAREQACSAIDILSHSPGGSTRRCGLMLAALCTAIAAYSYRPFPLTICGSVCGSVCLSAHVCPVHCGKTADRIWMRFGMIDRTGPGMRHIVGFGNLSTGRGNSRANMGCLIVTNGRLYYWEFPYRGAARLLLANS